MKINLIDFLELGRLYYFHKEGYAFLEECNRAKGECFLIFQNKNQKLDEETPEGIITGCLIKPHTDRFARTILST